MSVQERERPGRLLARIHNVAWLAKRTSRAINSTDTHARSLSDFQPFTLPCASPLCVAGRPTSFKSQVYREPRVRASLLALRSGWPEDRGEGSRGNAVVTTRVEEFRISWSSFLSRRACESFLFSPPSPSTPLSPSMRRPTPVTFSVPYQID